MYEKGEKGVKSESSSCEQKSDFGSINNVSVLRNKNSAHPP